MRISSALFGVFFLAGNAISHPVEEQVKAAAADDSSFALYSYNIPSSSGTAVKLFYADGEYLVYIQWFPDSMDI